MADTITNGWTSIFNGESVTNIDNLAGASSGTLDSEIYYTANNSVGGYCTTTRDGLLYDAGATQTAWANSHFKLLVNCGIVGLLDTIANGGMTVRFCGSTVGNYFEFRVGGSDSWPTTFSGGWALFVVDIEATPSASSSPPATNACRYVGISFVTSATMPRMADNTWLDNIEYLPDGNSGILIQGKNAGTTAWDWSDVIGTTAIRDAATCREGPAGSVVLSSPVTFFADDATDHEFSDTNKIILWDDQPFLASDFKTMTQIGAATGTSDLTAGVKNGTGDDATGTQGWVIAATGQSWTLDVDAANIDSSNWYGCQFSAGGTFQMDSSSVECISTLFNNVQYVHVANSTFLRNTIVQQGGVDNFGFAITDDMTDIKFCDFTAFSGSPATLGGHAIELTTPLTTPQTSKGNTFTNYTANNTADAAVYNNQAGAVTINVTDGGDAPSYRNGTSATTTVNSAVTVSLSGVTEGTSVKFIADETVGTVTKGDVLSEGFANSSGVYSFSLNYEGAFAPSGLDVKVLARNQGIAVAAIAQDDTVFTDETDEASSNTTADMTLLPATPVVPPTAITFVGSDIGDQGVNQTSITLTQPTHATDDFGIIFGQCYGVVATIDVATTGWTELRNDATAVGTDRTIAIWYKKYTSSSEANPVMSCTGADTQHSAALHVFRNVDTTTPFDATTLLLEVDTQSNPTNTAITTQTDNAALILFHHLSGNELTSVGLPTTPTGLTQGEFQSANTWRYQSTAYKLDVGTAATITPTAWTHTVTGNTHASSCYTMALRLNTEPLDGYLFGHAEKFSRAKVDVSTALSATTQGMAYQYWDGSDWTDLSGVTDGTDSFQNTGENIISWTMPGDWATTTVNSQGPLYYIRIMINVLTGFTTTPVGRKATLDTSRYLPYSAQRTITSSGLSDVATWTQDTIAKFSPT